MKKETLSQFIQINMGNKRLKVYVSKNKLIG